MLSEIRQFLVLAASGISLIGIPILITLLFRIYDAKLKALEKKTFKSVKDEVTALKELYELQIEELKKRIDDLDASMPELAKLDTTTHLENFQKLDEQAGNFGFVISRKKEEKMIEDILDCLSNYPEARKERNFRLIFSEYKKSIIKQQEIFDSLIKDEGTITTPTVSP